MNEYVKIVAGEGKYLTDGVFKALSVETTTPDKWIEVEGEILPTIIEQSEIIEEEMKIMSINIVDDTEEDNRDRKYII